MNTQNRSSGIILVALATILVYGCATEPKNIQSVDAARSAYQQASQNKDVQNNASVALYEAEKQLQKLNSAVAQGADTEELNHLAYLVEQKVNIAKANAQKQLASKQIDQLNEQRAQIHIDMRNAEAQQARQRAASLEQQLAQIKSAKMHEEARGTVLTLGDVFFDTGKATLKRGSEQNLDELALFLKNNPQRNVVIEGYTDSTGSAALNQQLSAARARAVIDYLSRQGITRDRLASYGYGESYPVATNTTAAGRQLNRRVEIVVLNNGETASTARRASQPQTEEVASFSELDKNHDGYVSKEESQQIKGLRDNFIQYDQDSDQQLNRTEFSAFEEQEIRQRTPGQLQQGGRAQPQQLQEQMPNQ